jgi:murein DD-endopeptidase MepM/ murein hydrolase activator NlpD
VIDHGGGVTTLYAHAYHLMKDAGDKAEKGELIAGVGSTGLSTGNHLHLEYLIDGVPVNILLQNFKTAG